ncbi:retrotransposon nucleocapsid protein [Lasallia pustulata]|uniref:Retrotransposon nucleocapsid protein n=1 Tax=Lasallia pustulata TaxID=136370 RepID=A0A1W5DC25_9LECA|nr:retrotransposon nucleocapsid protein [Lasallia pustulata]
MLKEGVVTTKLLKLAAPTIFTGNHKKLDTFLLQLTLYFKFNGSSFLSKLTKYSMHPTTYKEKPKNGSDHKSKKQEVQKLKQTQSAADYTAHFTQLSAATNWDDIALTVIYYAGLKDNVKDEIARGERLDDLRVKTVMAIRINN